ncbi:(2Fe-2S)-binding protein [Bradyrhizobium sp. LA6.12]|uniref:(2Fe-2S)-binding protein n=1 Tax=unclassified Bradyrhizobium TaxID=2631580 RepID=UPI0033915C95
MTVSIAFRLNGSAQQLEVDARITLADLLRDHLGLTGTKIGCNRGECGACTVHMEGRRILACMTLAAFVDGKDVVTIEGLVQPDGSMHAMQRAFVEHDAFQCGFCTPGQIMSAVACLAEGRAGDDMTVRHFMSGNLCRCGAYPNIVKAIRSVAESQG